LICLLVLRRELTVEDRFSLWFVVGDDVVNAKKCGGMVVYYGVV
jgi:hypothetical protein